MFGLQEIIVLAGIAGAVLFGPRLRRMIMEGEPAEESRRSADKTPKGLSMLMRLGIVGSVFLPCAAALIFTPWNGSPRLFLYVGLGPVVVGWAAWWIARGAKTS